MGEYFRIVNLDKKEYLHPHYFGTGIKLFEIAANECGSLTGLSILLSSQDNGDKDKIYGRWAGDRIIIAGDYSSEIYEEVQKWEPHCNISDMVVLKLCEDLFYREILMPRIKHFSAYLDDLKPLSKQLIERYGELYD